MIEKITTEELAVFETLCNPIECTEVLFSDLADLNSFEIDKYAKVRLYQYPMLSYESLFFENPELGKRENFKIKKGLGDCLNFGGRLTGKTLIGIMVDVFISVFHKTFSWGVISSCDATKIRGITDRIINVFDNHPILKSLNCQSVSHPAYRLNFNNGCLIESVNNNIAGKDPGKNWFQKHADKNWEEEGSFLNDAISGKKLMAQSEYGMVERLTGMSNFKRMSPVGRKFFDLLNENIVINLPSYANETWDEEKEDAAIKEFGGKQSPGYRTQILGEVVDDGNSVFDIERIRLCYKRTKNDEPILVKCFEIDKHNFFRYKEKLVLIRPKNAERVWINIDKGEGNAPTEIAILFEANGIYKYEINVTAFKLTPDQDNQLVDFIISQLQANIVGIDVTSGGGKAMFSYLSIKYPKNIYGVSFNEKIAIDFLRDTKNEIIYKNGEPQYQEEFVVDWSIQRLKHLFYSQKISALFDSKLDTQLDGVIVMKSGQRTVYGNKGANHLFQAFQVFAICQWNLEFKTIEPAENLEKPGKSAY